MSLVQNIKVIQSRWESLWPSLAGWQNQYMLRGHIALSLVLNLLQKSYDVPRGEQFSCAGAESDDSIFLMFVLGCCFHSVLLRPALCLPFLWGFPFCSSLIFLARCLHCHCTTESGGVWGIFPSEIALLFLTRWLVSLVISQTYLSSFLEDRQPPVLFCWLVEPVCARGPCSFLFSNFLAELCHVRWVKFNGWANKAVAQVHTLYLAVLLGYVRLKKHALPSHSTRLRKANKILIKRCNQMQSQ